MRKRRHHGKPRSFAASVPPPVVNIAQARSRRESIQPNRKPGIFVAVPSVDGRTNYTIALTFARAMASDATDTCPFRFGVHVEPSKRPVDFARNEIVRAFMHNTDADWLIMIDDDQMVPENFWMLCTVRDADIVSGLTPVWVAGMDAEAFLRVNSYGVNAKQQCYNLLPPPDEVQQPYRVPIVGTGCIAIRRRVFAPRPAGLGLSPFYFTYREDRKVVGGEDINFAVEANKAGFVVAVHPQVRFDHNKNIPLWQVESYYRARKAMEISGRQTTDEQRLSIG